MTSQWIADASGRFVALDGTAFRSYFSPAPMLPPVTESTSPDTIVSEPDTKTEEPTTAIHLSVIPERIMVIARQLKLAYAIFSAEDIEFNEYERLTDLRERLKQLAWLAEKAQENILRIQSQNCQRAPCTVWPTGSS